MMSRITPPTPVLAPPNGSHRKFTHTEFCDQYCPRVCQPFYHSCVHFADLLLIWFCAVGCGITFCMQQVFCSPGDAVKWSFVFAGGDFFVSLLRLLQS